MFVVREIDGERRIFKLEVPAFSIRAFCICAISVTGCMRRPRARRRRHHCHARAGGDRDDGSGSDDDGGGPPPQRSGEPLAGGAS